MAPPTAVSNDFRRARCAFCEGEIARVGELTSGRNVRFSTHEVVLDRTPELWRCATCRSGFIQNAIPEDVGRRLYSEGDASLRWTDPRPFEATKTREAVGALTRTISRGARVLDVGCNSGELLDFARELGAETAGVELSVASRAVCTAKKHRTWATLEEAAGDFDVITAFDLVEHVLTLPSMLLVLADKLKSGGRLVVLTGNIECDSAVKQGSAWWYAQPPEHVIFPSLLALGAVEALRVREVIPTFAAKQYEPRAWRRVWSAARNRSTDFDHMIVVLQRTDR